MRPSAHWLWADGEYNVRTGHLPIKSGDSLSVLMQLNGETAAIVDTRLDVERL